MFEIGSAELFLVLLLALLFLGEDKLNASARALAKWINTARRHSQQLAQSLGVEDIGSEYRNLQQRLNQQQQELDILRHQLQNAWQNQAQNPPTKSPPDLPPAPPSPE